MQSCLELAFYECELKYCDVLSVWNTNGRHAGKQCCAHIEQAH